MLTAKDSESYQVLGSEKGADDYVTKPFSPPPQPQWQELKLLNVRYKANAKGTDTRTTSIKG